MAGGLYDTLGFFQFPVPHGTAGTNTLSVPVATAVKWWYRVQTWQAVVTFSGNAATIPPNPPDPNVQQESLTVDGATGTQYIGMARLGGGGSFALCAAETDLLFPCAPISLLSSSSDSSGCSNSAGTPMIASAGVAMNLFSPPTASVGDERGVSLLYDPGAAEYIVYCQPTVGAGASGTDSNGALYQLTIGTNQGSNPTPVSVPVTIDGVSCGSLALYATAFVGGRTNFNITITGVTASVAITPYAWWSWGGKYNTSTGAPL